MNLTSRPKLVPSLIFDGAISTPRLPSWHGRDRFTFAYFVFSAGNFKIIISTNLVKWTQMKCEWGTQEIFNNSVVSEVCKETTSVD